jgi:5-methylcytosine-specific restriction endonuclease McrA
MQIVEKLKALVASERKITAQIIEHIQEIDQKKIYLQMGFSNLYAFLTDYIGYTPAAAQRRIEAARLLTFVPEVKEDLKTGSINLSQVSMVAQSIRQKQKEAPHVKFNNEDKKLLLDSVKGLTLETSQKVISQRLDLEVKAFEKQKIQSDESIRIELTLTKEQGEMLKKVKSLMSHVNPNASTSDVFEYLAKDYLKRKDPARAVKCENVKSVVVKKDHGATVNDVKISQPSTSSHLRGDINKELKITRQVQKTKKSASVAEATSRSRIAISASIKRAVWRRNHGICQHKNATTGKICGSTHLLEFDHIKRFRHGGDNHPNNLQLLCKAHNLWRG